MIAEFAVRAATGGSAASLARPSPAAAGRTKRLGGAPWLVGPASCNPSYAGTPVDKAPVS